MSATSVSDKKYITETLVLAFEHFSLSSAAYNRLREDFELPSVRTLTQLTFKVKNY